MVSKISSSSRFLITRPEKAAVTDAQILRDFGYQVFIEPMLSLEELDADFEDVQSFQALIFTSANAIDVFCRRCDVRDLPVYVVGENSADAARGWGFEDVQCGAGTAEDLCRIIAQSIEDPALPLLYLCAEIQSYDVADDLEECGLDIEERIVYRSHQADSFSQDCIKKLKNKEIDGVLLYSKRTAQAFSDCVERAQLRGVLKSLKVLCISESVLKCVQNYQWGDTYIADTPDGLGMLDLMQRHFKVMEKKDMSATKKKGEPIENAREVIERFGGIRPMAKKIDVAVTTIQGWKKRDVIPAGRRKVILEAAEEYNVDLSDLIKDAPPANQNQKEEVAESVKPKAAKSEAETKDAADAEEEMTIDLTDKVMPSSSQPEASAKKRAPIVEGLETSEDLEKRLAAVEKQVVGRNTWVVLSLLLLLAIGLAVVFWPRAGERESRLERLAALENKTQDLESEMAGIKEDQSFFGTLIPDDLDEQIAGLKEQAANTTAQVTAAIDGARVKAQDMSNDVLGEDAGTLNERAQKIGQYVEEITGSPVLINMLGNIDTMEDVPEGQTQLDRAMLEMDTILEGLGDQLNGENSDSVFTTTLNAARGQSEALNQTFEDVPTTDLKAAAMLLALTQFRSSLNRDNDSFQNDVDVLKKLVSEENTDLLSAIDKLSPHAESGVLTPSGLTNEFKTIAGDAVVASIQGEDVSVTERASARFNEVFQVEKDGELITGTQTQATVHEAEQLLEGGEIAAAVSLLEQLDGPAGDAFADWIKKAKTTLAAQDVEETLTQSINLRAYGLEDLTSGDIRLPTTSKRIHNEETGINILKPSRGPLSP